MQPCAETRYLAGGRSEELLLLLQLFSFGSQGLLLCVLLPPQVAGQTDVTHGYTYVTRPQTQCSHGTNRRERQYVIKTLINMTL